MLHSLITRPSITPQLPPSDLKSSSHSLITPLLLAASPPHHSPAPAPLLPHQQPLRPNYSSSCTLTTSCSLEFPHHTQLPQPHLRFILQPRHSHSTSHKHPTPPPQPTLFRLPFCRKATRARGLATRCCGRRCCQVPRLTRSSFCWRPRRIPTFTAPPGEPR